MASGRGSGNYRSPAGGEAGQAGRAGEGESRGESGGESGGESPGFYSSKPADRYARMPAADRRPPAAAVAEVPVAAAVVLATVPLAD